MKQFVLLALLGAATLSLTGCMGGIEMLNFGRKLPAPPTPAVCNNGRYQVVAVPGSANPNGASYLGAAIKIDTATGETWSMRFTDNSTLNGWSKIQN